MENGEWSGMEYGMETFGVTAKNTAASGSGAAVLYRVSGPAFLIGLLFFLKNFCYPLEKG